MEYIKNPEEVKGWVIHEGVEGKVVAEGRNMTGLMSIWAPKSELAVHVHPNEQIGICVSGVAVFTIAGKEYPVKKGDVYHIPPNIPHGERNDGDEPVVFMECFSPTREDLLRRRFEAKILD
jgi:quercetin dioxygenase-like cupin family protein